MTLRLFGGAFFCSGMCGLVYELLWVRMIGLQVGHTTVAVTVVLSAFMGGLALGSTWIERRPPKLFRRPLVFYAVLELGIAGWALLSPLFLRAIEATLLAVVQDQLAWSYSAKVLLRALAVAPVVMVPAVLMGATFPAAVQAWTAFGRSSRDAASRLYALNLAGAMTGALVETFVGMPLLGARGTLGVAVALNIAVALTVWRGGSAVPAVPEERREGPPAPLRMPLLVAGSLVITGLASMLGEVVWTRLYVLTLGSSVYAFSLVLFTYLGGLALGSWLSGKWKAEAGMDPRMFVGWAVALTGFVVLLTIPLFEWFPSLFVGLYKILPRHPWSAHALQLGLCMLGLLPSTTLMGMLFPMISHGGVEDFGKGAGRGLAAAYALTSLGNILGPLAGLGLLLAIGSQWALIVMAGLYLAVGAVWIGGTGGAWRPRALQVGGLAAAAVGLVWWQNPWDLHRLTSGPYVYVTKFLAPSAPVVSPGPPPHLPKGPLPPPPPAPSGASELLFYREGLSATVSVKRSGQAYYTMQVNGKTDASTGFDMVTQLLSGHLPLLWAPNARHALVVGLGSAVSLGSVLQHPVASVDAVELEPAVVEGARYFRGVNRGALEDARTRLVVDDGRNFLLLTSRRYDVMTIQVTNPWIAGVSSLFTREFYERCAARLAPEGLFCQWVQVYAMRGRDIALSLKTLQSVFPHCLVWSMDLPGLSQTPADLLVLASRQPLRWDRAKMQERFDHPAVKTHLRMVGIVELQQILDGCVMNEEGLRAYVGDAPLQTDDRPWLEFAAPRNLYDPSINLREVLLGLLAHRRPFEELVKPVNAPQVR